MTDVIRKRFGMTAQEMKELYGLTNEEIERLIAFIKQGLAGLKSLDSVIEKVKRDRPNPKTDNPLTIAMQTLDPNRNTANLITNMVMQQIDRENKRNKDNKNG